MSMNNALEWIKKANADLDTAKTLLEIDHPYTGIIGFHCQPAGCREIYEVVTTKHEEKQAILVDFRLFSLKGDYNNLNFIDTIVIYWFIIKGKQ